MEHPRQRRHRAKNHEPDDGDGKERGHQLPEWAKPLSPGRESLYVFNDLAEIEWALRIGREQIVDVEWDVRDVVLVTTLERLKTRAEQLDRQAKIPALRAGGGASIRVAWQTELRTFPGYQPFEFVRELAKLWKVVLHSCAQGSGGWLTNAATSRSALVSTPGLPRNPRSRNHSMKRSCHVPNGMPSRSLNPPPCTPLP